jgi:hypothetical protein
VFRACRLLVTDGRPAFYFFFFNLGPRFKVPLNFRTLSISAEVQSRMEPFPIAIGFGAITLPSSIHVYSVWRDTPILAATSDVV